MTHTRSVRLRWTGEGQTFEGSGASGNVITVDGDSEQGPSPMESLLIAVAACMAIDIRMILEKGRVPVRLLEIDADGERRPEAPKFFERVKLIVRLGGPGMEDQGKVQRAVDLSRDKYCSVLHTLRSDLKLSIEIVTV